MILPMSTNVDLFGGKIVPVAEVIDRIKARAAALPDIAVILGIPKHHTGFKNALLLEGDATISGDFVCDTQQKWIKKNQVCTIACFGDLNIDGDLINDDEKYWPIVFVGGNLSVCNIEKGGVPLLVGGNLDARGYIIGTYNDGPMRVGGDLAALGYIPMAADRKGERGHVINGAVRAPLFDARKDFSHEELHGAIVEEVLNYKWFNTHKLFEMGRKGESIWRDSSASRPTARSERSAPPIPSLNPADPTSLGTLRKCGEMLAQLEAMIQQREPKIEYPESFAEYVRIALNANPSSTVLVVEEDATVGGDLSLDWEAEWVTKNKVAALVCLKDLSVTGTIRNANLNGGPMLFVGGNLKADNLIKSGASVIVLGNVDAVGLVIGEYNDGLMRIAGDLNAAYYILLDHDGYVGGSINARELLSDDADLREILVDDVFETEDETFPSVDLLWAHQTSGRQILR